VKHVEHIGNSPIDRRSADPQQRRDHPLANAVAVERPRIPERLPPSRRLAVRHDSDSIVK
jgi:hypothetical protein